MKLALFYFAAILLSMSATLGHKVDTNVPLGRPQNSAPLNFVTGIAGLGVFVWFIAGFFLIPWYHPILAFCASVIGGGIFAGLFARNDFAPGIAVFAGLAAFLACACFFLI